MSKNLEMLHDAKVIDKDKMTPEQMKAIESLSSDEVKSLISIDKNLKDVHPTAGVVL